MMLSRRDALSSIGALLSVPAFSSLGVAGVMRRAGGPAEVLAAVRRGDLDQVRRLLAEDATLARSKDEVGRSAYVLAHLHGHEAIARLLRDAGLELDLVEAYLAEDWKRLEELARVDPEALHRAHPIGGNPLYAAALVGSRDGHRLRSLGCDPDSAPEGGSGLTPVRAAMESPRATWARIAFTDLCANGGDVNASQRGGSSSLHGAVLRRDEVLVRIAIRKGADVTAADEKGRTARALAVEIGWAEGAQLLAEHQKLPRDNRSSRFALDANREPVHRPDLSDVPLRLQQAVTGSSHSNLARVTELVAADPRLVFSISGDDELAIEACAHVGNDDIIRFHLDRGAPLSLPTAASLGDLAAVKFWLKRDPSLIHERGAHDFALMWYAVICGSIEVAELLAQCATPVDQESMGTTALHWCVKRDQPELACWLLEHGANPEPVGYFWNREGETPLQVALAKGDSRIAALLKERGARR